jgi:hypothetical protein
LYTNPVHINSGEAVVNSIVMEVAKEAGLSKEELGQLSYQIDPQDATAMFKNSIKEYFQKLANVRKTRPRGPDGRFISKP